MLPAFFRVLTVLSWEKKKTKMVPFVVDELGFVPGEGMMFSSSVIHVARREVAVFSADDDTRAGFPMGKVLVLVSTRFTTSC